MQSVVVQVSLSLKWCLHDNVIFCCVSVFYAELVDCLLCVDLTRFEDNGREVSTVGAIGEVLCLEAKT